MKAKYVLIAAVLVACVVSPLLAKGRTTQTLRRAVLPALSVQQKADLAFLREEEKLARDVYLGMFDLWGARIFSNISVSEQRHMDAVKGLLDKYVMSRMIAIGTTPNRPNRITNGKDGET